MQKPLSPRKVIASLLGSIIFWAVLSDAWGYSDFLFQSDSGAYFYGYFSRFVWVLPAILLIARYNDSLPMNQKDLFSPPRFNRSLIAVLIAVVLYTVTAMAVTHQGLRLNKIDHIGLVLVKYFLVAVVEETVFRGWGYHALTSFFSDRKAAIVSSVLFVLLHWPAFFIRCYRFGAFDYSGILTQSFSALLWGFITCWLLKKGTSLWNPIIAHFLYDFLSVLLIG